MIGLSAPELRKVTEQAEHSTPRWAMVDCRDPGGRGKYPPLDFAWSAGAPMPNPDVELPRHCYMGWMKAALSINEDGSPGEQPGRWIKLCEAYGFVTVTTKRLMVKLDAGLLVGQELRADRSLLMSVDYHDVVEAEVEARRGLLGATKFATTTLFLAGRNFGAARFRPERGIGMPWREDTRKFWGRNVEREFFEDVAAGLGVAPSAEETAVNVRDAPDGFIEFRERVVG
jgi:hypothetical protein